MAKSKIIKFDVIKNDDNDVKNNSLNKKIIKIQEKKNRTINTPIYYK
jgi:hypothetical protein